jgi:FkbM family methyltransferase
MGYLNYQDMYVSGESFALGMISNKNDPLILDVGAADNSEFVSRIMSKYPSSHIHAFEPNPKSYDLLVKNNQYKNVFYYKYGLGEKSKTLKLYDYKGSSSTQHASLYKENIVLVHNQKTISHSIQIKKLDDFMKGIGIDKPIDFLKIDTEGAELSVLKGATMLLNARKIRLIQFEFNVMNVYSRVFLRDFIEILPNYTLYKLLPDGLIPIHPYTPWLTEIFSFHNILAILEEK